MRAATITSQLQALRAEARRVAERASQISPFGIQCFAERVDNILGWMGIDAPEGIVEPVHDYETET